MKKSLFTHCNGHKISISFWSTSYLEDFKADQATSRALALYQSEFVIRSDEALIELWDSFLKSSEHFRALLEQRLGSKPSTSQSSCFFFLFYMKNVLKD